MAKLSGLARKAVGVAWRIGGLLLEARATCGHVWMTYARGQM